MKLPFLRTPQRPDDPTVVAMTGVRLGDKVHFWGTRPDLLLPLAARAGLSGQVTVVSADPASLIAAAKREGLLVDANPQPAADAGFDLAVVEAAGDWTPALPLLLAASRPGGRVVAISGEPRTGVFGRRRHTAAAGPSNAELVDALQAAGWRRARAIGERDSMRFVEATRT